MKIATRRLPSLLGALAAACGAYAAIACAASDDATPPQPREERLPLEDAGGVTDAASNEAGPAAGDCTANDFCAVSVPMAPLVALNAIWGSSSTDIWAVGTRGTILHGDGTSFTSVPSGTELTLFGVWGSATDDIWIATSLAPLHSTRLADGGPAWESVEGAIWNENAGQGRTWAIWGSSKGDIRMAGAASSRFNGFGSFWSMRSGGDGGVVWDAVDAYASGELSFPHIHGLWGSAHDDVWGVGMNGQVFHYEGALDGGAGRWVERNSLTTLTLEGVWGSSASDVWAVGRDGVIRRFANDPSQSVVAVPTPTSENLHAIWGSSQQDIWAVGDRGTILHYDGNEWTAADAGFASGFAPDLFGVWGSGSDDVWIVGEGIVLHRTAKNRRRP